MGKPVVDDHGLALGSIVDLVLQETGAILAVVKRDGGGFACVPLEVLQPQLEPADTRASRTAPAPSAALVAAFVFGPGRAELLAVEAVSAPDTIDVATVRRCREHFAAGAPVAGADAPAPPRDERSLAEKLADAVKPLGLRKLVGATVRDTQGTPLGEVKDVIVDLGRLRVAYVIIATSGAEDSGDSLHGVAIGSLRRVPEGRWLVLAGNRDTLNSSPGLDLAHLPPIQEPADGATAAGPAVTRS